ncbi:retrovirus-related pol polyprotein from transposon TNT 1-94 [Tanacetum coccineum]
MRPFGCPITILNTIDYLGKFDGKANEGFFVGYSLNSKAFRVFNSRTRIMEENLHIMFRESRPNVVGSGLDWLFDIDALTRTMNYESIVAGTQSNGFADLKSSQDDGSKPSSDDEKKVDEDPREESEYDPKMPALEDVSIFDFSIDDEDDDAVADMNNLDTIIQVSHVLTTRIHKDHPLDQVIGDLQSATQTRKMTKNLEEHGGIVIRNKARLVAQGNTQEEGIDYDEVFAPVSRIEAIMLFLAYASFKDFVVYQMDEKVCFSMGRLKKRFYVDDIIFGSTKELCIAFEKLMHEKFQMSSMGELTLFLGLQVKQKKDDIFTSQDKYDEDGEEVDVHMYRSMIGSLMYLTSSRPDIMFAMYACARYQVNPKVLHLHAFRYLKGKPKLGLWYPKDSPFDLVAYIDSDYTGSSLDRKSTIGGCQFLGCKLISWHCKKQTVVANSTTEAEYVAASSCC